MHVAITIWAIIASWKWWNWDNFHKYHATILYMSLLNLLYGFLTSGYFLWKYQPDLGLPLSIVTMLHTFITFPCTVMLYLSRYPKSVKSRILHNLKWIIIYFGIELLASFANRITYDHGWHLGWSLLFVLIMFPMLRLHYKRPVWAYLLSIVFIVFLLYTFNIPWKVPVEERLLIGGAVFV